MEGRLGTIPPTQLVDSRLQAHWAAQVILATADGWIEAKPDDSHTNLEWRDGALVGNPTPAGLAIGLRLADLVLLAAEETLPLSGRTLAEALRWADERVARAAGTSPRGIKPRDYDMPAHPVSTGAAFALDRPRAEELARWFATADGLLRELAAAEPGATPIRCWPHHFDIAGIVFLDPVDTARQIGFGLSPGDGYYGEPYFYVTPWPIREGAVFPALAGGHWHREGFTGAILPGSAVVSGTDARAWLAQAVAAAKAVIPSGP